MGPKTLTTRDAGTLDWLTLRECAAEMNVGVEVVRQWCVRWRENKPGGLPYAHAGAKPESESARVEYRIHRDDWEAFKRERRQMNAVESRRITRLCAAPIDYGGTRAAGVSGRGR
jgi:hypothetical protein